MTIAGELARRIKAFRYDDIPDTAVTWAKVGILDTIGVTLAGAGEECVSIVKRVQGISEETDSGPCLIFGGGRA
ncbi:MAG TPA: MmgE/PrpD family protein, partial [Rhodospirillales bacterium]|nr:MmgE/PrpD family protein [Rhodospirillales bacterium]